MNDDIRALSGDSDGIGFEDFGQENGTRFWYASDLMRYLGYEHHNFGAVNRAMAACAALNIPIHENFVSIDRDMEGKRQQDFKLSRFACYLTAMNGDTKKPQVAAAQAYFAGLAEAFSRYAQEVEHVERVAIREEVSEHERALSGAAKKAGVTDYALFQNAGYRGLYNMNLGELRRLKAVPSGRSPLDFMGKTELAANLFRVTQTEEKIRRDGIRGQQGLESTAQKVGQEVRQTMIRISGTKPESLPPAPDIKEVHKDIKAAHRGLKKLDRDPKSRQ